MLPFEEARVYARSLGLVSEKEWLEWSKGEERPSDIPATPDRVYEDKGWKSWGDFLGFRPSDIPSEPDKVYKDKGWKSYGDFLGYHEGNVAGKWRTFEKARVYVRSLGIKSKKKWLEWRKSGERPTDIPATPDQVYLNEGWKSWGDFLGYHKGNVAGEWLPFEKARVYAQSLGLKSEKPRKNGWSGSRAWRGLTSLLPLTESTRTKDGRAGATSWGTTRENGAGEWLPFEKARVYAWSLGLKSEKEWLEWRKSGERPTDIPATPDRVYKGKGWKSWGDFLGYKEGNVAGKWRTFEEARDYVRSLGLESEKEWLEWSKTVERPSDIPATPDRVYKDKGSWKSWGDFLAYNPHRA